MSFHVPEKFRLKNPKNPMMRSDESNGNNGVFQFKRNGIKFTIIASDGMGWEHVSISTAKRCPTWKEMCAIKALFWDPEDCVVQYHPPESEYVNFHPYTLHLWRYDGGFPMPPSVMVGPKI